MRSICTFFNVYSLNCFFSLSWHNEYLHIHRSSAATNEGGHGELLAPYYIQMNDDLVY